MQGQKRVLMRRTKESVNTCCGNFRLGTAQVITKIETILEIWLKRIALGVPECVKGFVYSEMSVMSCYVIRLAQF